MHVRSLRLPASAAPLLALAIAAACNGGEAEAAADSQKAPAVVSVATENLVVVATTQVSSGPAISGTLAPEREATVRAQTSGTVLQTFVDQGSRVSRGTPLARINDAPLRDAYLSARSGYTTAQASADLAKREMERSRTLAQAGAIAERDREAAERANIAAQSQLADAQARLTLAKQQLDDASIQAPIAGVVSARFVNAGDVVQPGGQLFTVVDPTSMRLEASVAADQLSAVKVGGTVTFTASGYPGRTFTGRVARINPTADPATGQVRIVVTIPNSTSALVGGLFAEGRVASESRQGLTVPQTAVDQRGVKPWVLRVKNGRTERVEVQLGLRDEEREQVEIVSGVVAGDTLLTGAAQGISPGTPVRANAPADRPVAKQQ